MNPKGNLSVFESLIILLVVMFVLLLGSLFGGLTAMGTICCSVSELCDKIDSR